jgi:hypothetical protein
MSLQSERQKTHDLFDMSVICWRCDAPMKIKTIAPVLLSSSLDEIVYSCPACHIERKRTVTRANSQLMSGQSSISSPQAADEMRSLTRY